MELFTLNHLNFAYPEQEKQAVSDLTLSVHAGEFLVLCGPSGCGKSTLLRQLKPVLAPHGAGAARFCLRADPWTSYRNANRQRKSGLSSRVRKTRS